MLLRRMVRMGMPRRLKAYRVLSLALCSLALVGWGAFAERRAELTQLKASQEQLPMRRTQHQQAMGDLNQLQAKLVLYQVPLIRTGEPSRAVRWTAQDQAGTGARS